MGWGGGGGGLPTEGTSELRQEREAGMECVQSRRRGGQAGLCRGGVGEHSRRCKRRSAGPAGPGEEQVQESVGDTEGTRRWAHV